MMEIVQAFLLGVVQGITELFPISSSLHVLLVNKLFVSPLQDPKTFESIIQLGSACAILLRLRGDITMLIRGLVRKDASSCSYSLSLLIAFLPAVVVGVLFHSWIKSAGFSTSAAAIALIVGGVIFVLIDPMSGNLSKTEPTKRNALVIGLFQIFAFCPGVSRLGSTLIGGTCAGLARSAALRFSFLLAVPILFGAGCFEFLKIAPAISLSHFTFLVPGFIMAFLGTYMLFPLVFRYLSDKGFFAVGVYRIALGVLLLI